MYAIHIGSAALAPVSRFPSGRNSSNPIQVVATRSGVEPGEPGVVLVVGGARLAGDVVALQHPRLAAGAAADDVAHQGVHQPRVAGLEDAGRAAQRRRTVHGAIRNRRQCRRRYVGRGRRRRACALRHRPASRMWTPAVTSSSTQSRHTTSGSAARDELTSSPSRTRWMKYGSTSVSAIGEHAVPGGDLERRQHAAAERERQAPGQLFDVDAEPGDVLQREVDADLAQQPNRDEVARLVQRGAQRGGAVELATVVLGPPRPLEARVLEHHRGVVDDAGRGVAVLQGGGVDERLEARSGLTLGLDRTVELAAVEVESTGQGDDRAVVRVERDQRPLHVRGAGRSASRHRPPRAARG